MESRRPSVRKSHSAEVEIPLLQYPLSADSGQDLEHPVDSQEGISRQDDLSTHPREPERQILEAESTSSTKASSIRNYDQAEPYSGPVTCSFPPHNYVSHPGPGGYQNRNSIKYEALEEDSGRVGHNAASWQPYTLRWWFLALLAVSMLTLLLLVSLLLHYSVKNDGLGSDDDSTMQFFGWRFTPSLLAVFYVQLTAMLLDDVKRTEAFAQMAKFGGAPAYSSILRAPGAWWNALADGFSKKGGRSWVLVSSALINIIGFLVVSPLSSSLLEPMDISISTDGQFSRMAPEGPISPTSGRETMLRTIGHLLQDVSTSAWISDDYTIIPFWPSDRPSAPLGPFLATTPQEWEAETTVLNTELECKTMSLVRMKEMNVSDIPIDITVAVLDSGDGCTHEFRLDPPFGSWYDNRTLVTTELTPANWTSGCGEREFILIAPTNETALPVAQICSANYYMAEMNVTARISSTFSEMVFDEEEYRKKRSPIPDSFLDVNLAQNLSLGFPWSDYLVESSSSMSRPPNTGLMVLFGALYNFNFKAMVDDHDLLTQASRVKQRIFGEVLQYSLQEQHAPERNINGTVTVVATRIVVTSGVAIALATFFFLSLCLLAVLWTLSGHRFRPLNLRQDPATTTGVASLIVNAPTTQNSFKHASTKGALQEKRYFTTPSVLHESSEITRADLGA